MWKLRFLSDVDGENVIDLVEAGITIGRDPENIICIEDGSLSKFHAVLVRNGNDYKIFDVHSTNGTFVNGQRITFASMRNGDKLRLGNIEMEYVSAVKRTVLRPQLGGAVDEPKNQPSPTPIPEPAPSPRPALRPTVIQEPPPKPLGLPKTAPAVAAPAAISSPSPTPPPAPAPFPAAAQAKPHLLTSVPPPSEEPKSFIRTSPGTTQPKKSTSSSKGIMAKLGIGQSSDSEVAAPAVPPPLPAPVVSIPVSVPSQPPPQPVSSGDTGSGPVVVNKRAGGRVTIGGSSGGSSGDESASGGSRKKIVIAQRPPQG